MDKVVCVSSTSAMGAASPPSSGTSLTTLVESVIEGLTILLRRVLRHYPDTDSTAPPDDYPTQHRSRQARGNIGDIIDRITGLQIEVIYNR